MRTRRGLSSPSQCPRVSDHRQRRILDVTIAGQESPTKTLRIQRAVAVTGRDIALDRAGFQDDETVVADSWREPIWIHLQIFGCTDNPELNVKTAIRPRNSDGLDGRGPVGTNSDSWQHRNAGQRSIVFVRLNQWILRKRSGRRQCAARHLLLDGFSRDACQPRSNGWPLPPECRSF
jgi:hypothetical protein